jgi:hypothetical protein
MEEARTLISFSALKLAHQLPRMCDVKIVITAEHLRQGGGGEDQVTRQAQARSQQTEPVRDDQAPSSIRQLPATEPSAAFAVGGIAPSVRWFRMHAGRQALSSALRHSPHKQTQGPAGVLIARLGPLVGGPDGGVAVHVRAVLGVEAEHAVAL